MKGRRGGGRKEGERDRKCEGKEERGLGSREGERDRKCKG